MQFIQCRLQGVPWVQPPHNSEYPRPLMTFICVTVITNILKLRLAPQPDPLLESPPAYETTDPNNYWPY